MQGMTERREDLHVVIQPGVPLCAQYALVRVQYVFGLDPDVVFLELCNQHREDVVTLLFIERGGPWQHHGALAGLGQPYVEIKLAFGHGIPSWGVGGAIYLQKLYK